MKSLKFFFILSIGMFLSIGSIQAQKACTKPCKAAKTAKVNSTDHAATTASAVMVNQETTTSATKKCNPKNCNPKNCNPKNCPPGCDISKCMKGTKTDVFKASTSTERKTIPVAKVTLKE